MGKIYKKLAPPPWLLQKYKQDLDTEFYTANYTEHVLNKLNPEEVFQELGNDAIMLCWEGKNKFCHRHIVAKWLEKQLNIKISEI